MSASVALAWSACASSSLGFVVGGLARISGLGPSAWSPSPSPSSGFVGLASGSCLLARPRRPSSGDRRPGVAQVQVAQDGADDRGRRRPGRRSPRPACRGRRRPSASISGPRASTRALRAVGRGVAGQALARHQGQRIGHGRIGAAAASGDVRRPPASALAASSRALQGRAQVVAHPAQGIGADGLDAGLSPRASKASAASGSAGRCRAWAALSWCARRRAIWSARPRMRAASRPGSGRAADGAGRRGCRSGTAARWRTRLPGPAFRPATAGGVGERALEGLGGAFGLVGHGR